MLWSRSLHRRVLPQPGKASVGQDRLITLSYGVARSIVRSSRRGRGRGGCVTLVSSRVGAESASWSTVTSRARGAARSRGRGCRCVAGRRRCGRRAPASSGIRAPIGDGRWRGGVELESGCSAGCVASVPSTASRGLEQRDQPASRSGPSRGVERGSRGAHVEVRVCASRSSSVVANPTAAAVRRSGRAHRGRSARAWSRRSRPRPEPVSLGARDSRRDLATTAPSADVGLGADELRPAGWPRPGGTREPATVRCSVAGGALCTCRDRATARRPSGVARPTGGEPTSRRLDSRVGDPTRASPDRPRRTAGASARARSHPCEAVDRRARRAAARRPCWTTRYWFADRPDRTSSLCRMIMRMSSLFVRTLREDPADAEVPSHRLLVRAGYIRRAAPGIYTWLPLGLKVLRKIEGIIREEMDGIGAQELQLPGAAAPGALRGDRPLDRVRRQHLPAQGPQGRRLPARAHPRGDVHPRGQGPLLLLQGPAALDLPDPDEVPRRGASARRPAARPRVRHEGLLLLRRRRRRPGRQLPDAPRRLHPDLRPARLRVRHRQGDVGRDGRLEVRGVPREGRRRRGHLRPLHHLRLRRQRRGRAGRAPHARRVRRRARRPRRADARHPDHRHAWSTTSTTRSPATTGPGRRATPSRTSW